MKCEVSFLGLALWQNLWALSANDGVRFLSSSRLWCSTCKPVPWDSSRGVSRCLGLAIHVSHADEAPEADFSLTHSCLLQPLGNEPLHESPLSVFSLSLSFSTTLVPLFSFSLHLLEMWEFAAVSLPVTRLAYLTAYLPMIWGTGSSHAYRMWPVAWMEGLRE